MVRIASHHSWKDKDFRPACAWPDDCLVQWGKSGVVFRRDGGDPYITAFFEAFPEDNAGGFIRGEGPTIGEAEANAFAKHQRQVACEHVWGRSGYDNGGALCKRCRAFKSVFKPIVKLGEWRAPLNRIEDDYLTIDEDETFGGRTDEAYARKLRIRKRLFGVEPPRHVD